MAEERTYQIGEPNKSINWSGIMDKTRGKYETNGTTYLCDVNGFCASHPFKQHWARPIVIDALEQMGFYDSTFGWNTCPSWTHDRLVIQVNVDLPFAYSEHYSGSKAVEADYQQYTVYRCLNSPEEWGLLDHSDAYYDALLSTNDTAELVALIVGYEADPL